jgi:Sulfatase-modifying factor enzyme 1
MFGRRLLPMLLVGACAAAPTTPPPPRPAASTAASPRPSASSNPQPGAPIPRGERKVFGTPRPQTLATEVRPVEGQQLALFVAQEPGRATVHLQFAGAPATGRRTLRGRQLVAAVGDWLLTSQQDALCTEPLHAPLDASARPRCTKLRADRALTVAGRAMVIEERVVDPDDPDEPRRPGKPAKRPPKARKNDSAGKQKPPTEVRLWLHPIAADGSFEEAIDTEIVFARPLVGMGLLDAIGTPSGAQLLWYEHLEPRRDKRRKIPRALLRQGRLSKSGKLRRTSRKMVMKGDRGYGSLEGHDAGRLVVEGDAAAYVGRFDDPDAAVKRGFEAIGLRPARALSAPDAVFGVDPWRLLRAGPIEADELARLQTLWSAAPRLSAGQRAIDSGRVAWAGHHGWFVTDGDPPVLHRANRIDGAIEAQPQPFVAQRTRLSWASLLPSGHGLAATSDALFVVDGDEVRSAGPTVAPPTSEPARIAASWWAIARDGRLSQLVPTRRVIERPPIPAGLGAVVGGEAAGMLITLDHGQLTLSKLHADGRIHRLGSQPTAIAHGLVAVARARGGALIAGIAERPRRVVALAVDADGARLSTADGPKHTGPKHMGIAAPTTEGGRLWLRALPAGGAVLADPGRERVAWLDDTGHERAVSDWPEQASEAACVDGEPARLHWPSPTPGRMVRARALSAPGTCVSAEPILRGATLSWIGTTVKGLDSRAELAHAALDEPHESTAPAPTAATPTPPSATKRSPCAPEMVSIRGAFCIDRFEATLVQAADGAPISPYYPSTPRLTGILLGVWSAGRWTTGDLHARAMPLPPLLRARGAAPAAVPRVGHGVVPNGYVSGHGAKKACTAVGKRLCSHQEWKTACRGEQERKFPYGDDYRQGTCNLFRYAHPAATLHGNPAVGHLDPRLNLVRERGKPLLEATGSRAACASKWGEDAVYDMVGNLDEWVEKKSGAFAGGFFSRSSRSGCDAIVSAHPRRYLDYSLGIRCCSETSR